MVTAAVQGNDRNAENNFMSIRAYLNDDVRARGTKPPPRFQDLSTSEQNRTGPWWTRPTTQERKSPCFASRLSPSRAYFSGGERPPCRRHVLPDLPFSISRPAPSPTISARTSR